MKYLLRFVIIASFLFCLSACGNQEAVKPPKFTPAPEGDTVGEGGEPGKKKQKNGQEEVLTPK